MCGDSRHDLNYPEIPNSWNNKEKTTMTNFNEKINSHKGLFLLDQYSEYFIERVGSMWMFKQKIDDDLYLLTNTYRLFIQYKTTHRAKKLRGVVSCGITRMETTWQIPAMASSCEA